VQTTSRSGRRIALAGGILAVAALALSACTSTTDGEVSAGSPVARNDSTSTPAAPTTSQDPGGPAVITLPAKLTNISPSTPLSVQVASGTITDVTLTNPEGKHVKGTVATDGSSWASTEELGYSKSYKLTVHATGTDGAAATKKATITTVTPSNLTMPYLNSTGGLPLQNGATYGVGIVPVVHFDEPITNRKAAEKALEVSTVPHVEGVWNWIDAQNVHFRPKEYWPSGTKVTITARVYGVQVGSGLYGQQDVSVSFKIGVKYVSVADDTTHRVYVYKADHRIRVMKTSMGMHLYVPGTNGQVSLYTMDGTYTVIGHENPANMSSESFGLPANSPYGYAPEKVYLATKISTDGIYLHSAPWSLGDQGNTDVSHGCLNLSPEDAQWFYDHSKIGDPVIVRHVGGPKIQIWQNGDWSVPWTTWVKGSALH